MLPYIYTQVLFLEEISRRNLEYAVRREKEVENGLIIEGII